MERLLSLTLFAFSFTAVAAGPPTTTTPPQKPAVSAKGAAQLSDAQIEAAIRQRFQQSKIKTNNFQVSVRNGTATITGKTDVIQHKATATRIAKRAGARAVDNQVVVSDAARQRAAASLEKGRRRAQVKRSEVSTR